MNENISEPKQLRSIQKKNKIKESGFRLICEKGYFNTNTVEIAKDAGVSTGIVYRYFKDKKQIFAEAIIDFFDKFVVEYLNAIENISLESDLEGILSLIIDRAVVTHSEFKNAEDEMSALAHYDKEFNDILEEIVEKYINIISEKLCDIGFSSKHIHEKIHLIFKISESYIHEIAYSKKDCKDYDYIKKCIIGIALNLLRSE